MTLTEKQQQKLEAILQSANAEQQRNARVLLLYAGGKTTREIAQEVELSESRTRFWRKVFEREGMAMFEEHFVPPRRAGTQAKNPRTAFRITADEHAKLRALRNGDIDAERKRRIDILLAYADGKQTAEIAARVGLSASRTRFWRKAFEREGLAVVAPGPDTAAPSVDGASAAPESIGEPATVQHGKKKLPDLAADDSLSEAGRKVLRLHFEEMLTHGENDALGSDPEIVHKMRVATRRMRSAFEVFDGAFTEKTVRQFRKPLKRTGKILGRVRDLDVLLLHMREYSSGLSTGDSAAFQPLIAAWEQDRGTHLSSLREYLRSDSYRDFCVKFGSFVRSPGKGNAADCEVIPGVAKHITHIAPVLVMDRYTDILAFDTEVETATLDRLHALRIHCKKLRYTLEFLQELLGPSVKKNIRHVTDMQDYLGHLQDDQTAGHMITTFVQELDDRQAHLPVGERLNAAPLLTYLAERQARKHQLLTDFPETWKRFIAADFRKRLLQSLLSL